MSPKFSYVLLDSTIDTVSRAFCNLGLRERSLNVILNSIKISPYGRNDIYWASEFLQRHQY